MSLLPFSDLEKSIIKNMMLNKSHKDIAQLLDREKGDVTKLIEEFITDTGIITYQMKLDARPRKETIRKPAVKKVNVKKEEQKRKDDYEKLKKKIQNDLEKDLVNKRKRGREPLFKTKVVDQSQMIHIRIDARTFIEVPKGSNVKEAKEKFLSNQSNYKHEAPMERAKVK